MIAQFITSLWTPLQNSLTLLLAFFTSKPFELINIIFQTILFTSSALNLLCYCLSAVGLHRVGSLLFYNHYSYTLMGILFCWLHVWQLAIGRPFLVMNLLQFSGAYVSLCASQGCYYMYSNFATKKKGGKFGEVVNLVILLVVFLCGIYVMSHPNYSEQHQHHSQTAAATYHSQGYQYQYQILTLKYLAITTTVLSVIVILVAAVRQISLLYPLIAIVVAWTTIILRLKNAQYQLQCQWLQTLSIPFEVFAYAVLGYQAVSRQGQIASASEHESTSEKSRTSMKGSKYLFKATLFFVMYGMMKGMTVQFPILLLIVTSYEIARSNWK